MWVPPSVIWPADSGMRPIAELMLIDFVGRVFRPNFEPSRQIPLYVRQAKPETPVVIRALVGAGFSAAAQHSQMLTPMFTHIPGLKVVCPSTPADAKGLLAQAVRRQRPGNFLRNTKRSTA